MFLSLLLFSPVYEVNMSICCLFLLHNQSDKGNNIKIMPLSAVFIALYFGTGYELWSREKSITNIIMNVANLLQRLGMISLWVFIRTAFFSFPFYHSRFLQKIHICHICLQIFRCSKGPSIFLSYRNVTSALPYFAQQMLKDDACRECVWGSFQGCFTYWLLKLPFNLLYSNTQGLNYFSGILIDCCNSALHYMHIWCHH